MAASDSFCSASCDAAHARTLHTQTACAKHGTFTNLCVFVDTAAAAAAAAAAAVAAAVTNVKQRRMQRCFQRRASAVKRSGTASVNTRSLPQTQLSFFSNLLFSPCSPWRLSLLLTLAAYNSTTVPPSPEVRTLIGSHTLRVERSHWACLSTGFVVRASLARRRSRRLSAFRFRGFGRSVQRCKSSNQSIMYFYSGPSNKITSGSTGGGE